MKEQVPGWVKFETLAPGAKFHNVERVGIPTQYIKLQSDPGTYAVNTDSGQLVIFDLDAFVFPVDNGWISELACYDFQKEELERQMAEGGHRSVVAYVMSHCAARKADLRWRKAVSALKRAIDNSQVDTCERPWNCFAVRHTSRKTWLVRSSAVEASRTIRRMKR